MSLSVNVEFHHDLNIKIELTATATTQYIAPHQKVDPR